jgi:hypothetical protein
VGYTPEAPVARLWELEWNADKLSCAIYRQGTGLQLRVESAVAVIVTERFDMQPRALARARALREGLKRRGWRDAGDQPLSEDGFPSE